MAYQSDGIDPGASPTLGVFNDATASGHVQGVKLIDSTVGSTAAIGTVGNPLWTQSVAGGATSTGYHAIAAASTNAANLKASSALLVAVHVFNNAAYPIYIKLYNKAATPTVGTDTPKMTIGVQAGTQRDVLCGPETFGTGLGIAMVKGITDADATAVLLSDCAVDVEYI